MATGPTWTVGDVTVTSVIETDQHWKWEWLLPNVTTEQIDQVGWLKPHFVDDVGKLVLRIQALVVESQGKRIVVDTCVGNDKPRPTPLFNNLSTSFFSDLISAGFSPESIDFVVCTHLHVDHVGWNTRLVDNKWVPSFPQARYLFGRKEYQHWMATDDSERFGDVMADSVAPVVDAGLADLVESDHCLTDEVRLEPTPGHTPGHHSIVITSGTETAVITGDMIHHPIQFAFMDLSSSADSDSQAAIQSRRTSFQRWHDNGALVIGTHFAGPGAGKLEPNGDGWNYRF